MHDKVSIRCAPKLAAVSEQLARRGDVVEQVEEIPAPSADGHVRALQSIS